VIMPISTSERIFAFYRSDRGISRGKFLLLCANGSLSVTVVIFSIGNLGRSCDRRDNDPSSDNADDDVVRRKCRGFNDLVTSSPY